MFYYNCEQKEKVPYEYVPIITWNQWKNMALQKFIIWTHLQEHFLLHNRFVVYKPIHPLITNQKWVPVSTTINIQGSTKGEGFLQSSIVY
jgi:hypothetical protein